MASERADEPGNEGERRLQERFDTVEKAGDFYESSLLDHLNERMRSFLRDRRTVFVGCTSRRDTTRVRVRSGPNVVDVDGPHRIAWEESADTDVLPRADDADHATLLAVDWEDTTVGVHVNGAVTVERGDGALRCAIDVEEAYVHCAKHVPRLERDPAAAAADATAIPRDATVERLYREFVADRIFFLLGTADADGETDVSPRFGPCGFVQLTDDGLAYPEYRGNGVHASLGNMLETGRACFTFLDMWRTGVALYVEGTVALREDAPASAVDVAETDRTKVWVELEPDTVSVAETDVPAYSLVDHDPPWGTDDEALKRAGFFTDEE